MSSESSPSHDGTNIVPISSEERRELAQKFNQLTCPNCGDTAVRIVGKLAPEDAVSETKETFKGGLQGATAGGLVGAIGGPAGVALGMSIGSFIGSTAGSERAEKKQLAVDCDCCGHRGRAA